MSSGNEAAASPALPADYADVLWRPSPEWIDRARITGYRRWLAARGQLPGGTSAGAGSAEADYRALWEWSVSDPAGFWGSLWDYFGVLGERGGGPVLAGGPMPEVTWFQGASLNYARNALHAARDDPGRTAVIARDEDGREARLTYGQLAAEVARVRSGLEQLGVGRGDRVAGFLPNIPAALIAMLAAASLGAIWSSCSPDFGARSVIDRLAQISPKVLFAVDSYRYGGKDFDRREALAEILTAMPDLAAVVLAGPDAPGSMPAGVPAVAFGALGDPDAALEFTEVPFDHPLWVLYSSGTTGLPKAIMHSHGGIVLEHLKALAFHQDLGESDVFLWYTTTGWMMWNYLVGGLLVGAAVVLYDGSPAYPVTGALWRAAAETGVTYLGTGAPYLLACAKAGLTPGTSLHLSRLRGVGSTGSPLPPEGFRWVYRSVGKGLLLGSFSGGTDLCTGFVGPSPLLPVRAGIIAGPCLGAKVEAFDSAGRALTGEVGELVLTRPMPSMPVGFWGDEGKRRYRASYFAEYPGRWRHGDWIMMLADGGCVIFGRSDATLNRGGVRMGTSEFYRVVERFEEVADSLVVDTGQIGSEGRLLLYLVLAAGAQLSDELAAAIKAALRAELSPRHVPDEIHQVPAIPRTLSGKKLEVPVRRILLGTPVAEAADPDALANPEVLALFARHPGPA